MLQKVDRPTYDVPRSWNQAGRAIRSETALVSPAGEESILDILTESAERLITIGSEAIDDGIRDGLRRIANALRLDWAVICHKGENPADIVVSHSWTRALQPALPDPARLASTPFFASIVEARCAAWFSRPDEVSDPVDRHLFVEAGVKSLVVIPLTLPGDTGHESGALAMVSQTTEREWRSSVIEQLKLASAVFGQALVRKAGMTALNSALDELQELRELSTEPQLPEQTNIRVLVPSSRLRDEHQYLRREALDRAAKGTIVGRSAAVQRVLEQARQVAATDSTVLLLGETGTGKELIASQIHELSARRGRVMVRVNCAAIPSTLIESELFGREKGAFTGALARQAGRFEIADRSTIFLDEIGDLPGEVQVKLLRVLEERQVERLGSPKAIQVDTRIIAATHRNLEKRIGEGTFREDLFYRLNVFPIQVPPLRDRIEDIPLLVWRFVDEFARSFGKRIDTISKENMAALQQYPWPGNIRELRNVVERAMIVATDRQLTIVLPKSSSPVPGKHSVKMADIELEHVRSVLESSGWRIRGTGGAAERLGLRPTTLETRMAKLGLTRPKH
jgi:transcriptional regulator with GAF, ATPase, and Fis domain